MQIVCLVFAALAILTFVLGFALAHFSIVPPIRGFGMTLIASLHGVIAIVLAGIGAAIQAVPVPVALACALTGAIPVLWLLSVIRSGRLVPRLNDVSTDLVVIPELTYAAKLPENAGKDLAYKDRFKAKVRERYSDLKPFETSESPERLFERALAAAKAMPGWNVHYSDPESLRIEGYETSRLFRFRDDFVIRIRAKGTGSSLDMRSRSRDGNNDFGANAARIRRFLRGLRA